MTRFIDIWTLIWQFAGIDCKHAVVIDRMWLEYIHMLSFIAKWEIFFPPYISTEILQLLAADFFFTLQLLYIFHWVFLK